MQKAHDQGIVHYSINRAVYSQKRYLDEMQGNPVDTIWEDIRPIPRRPSQERSRLPYAEAGGAVGAHRRGQQ